MPKLKAPLSWKRITSLPDGRHYVGHVPGLAVQRDGGAKSWLAIFTSPLTGEERELGLGSLREVSLKQACEAALAARALVRQGIDPIEDKRERRHQTALGARPTLTFAAAK